MMSHFIKSGTICLSHLYFPSSKACITSGGCTKARCDNLLRVREETNTMVSGPTGNKPCNEKWQRGSAARPRRFVESHPENQDPAGASREGGGCQPAQSALCKADQVFQTGTRSSINLQSNQLSVDSVEGFRCCQNILLKWRL